MSLVSNNLPIPFASPVSARVRAARERMENAKLRLVQSIRPSYPDADEFEVVVPSFAPRFMENGELVRVRCDVVVSGANKIRVRVWTAGSQPGDEEDSPVW